MVNYTQRVDEWTDIDVMSGYHANQWKEPKRSTLAFANFVNKKLSSSKKVIDLGAGGGAATAYLARSNKNVDFVAADYVDDFLKIGKKLAAEQDYTNLSFEQVDWYNLTPSSKYDGVISLQTLSWLPECAEPLKQIFTKLNPQWLALTSLFYEGDISCTIEVNEPTRDRKSFYNVYPIPEIERICRSNGYSIKEFEKFEIDTDIQQPDNKDFMGTYTKRVMSDNGIERLQISGPILMPWYMILIEKV